jgi:hypothetical protein
MNRCRPQALLLVAALTSLPLLVGCSSPDAGAAGDPSAAGTAEEAATRDTVVHTLYTISYAPNSYVIGNAYAGWTDLVQGKPQFSRGPGNPDGHSYRWGYIFGENFDHCGWVSNGVLRAGAATGNRCGAPQQIDTPHFMATYTNGIHNHLAGDGSLTHMQYDGAGCSDKNGYGNVGPWRVPATPANSLGQVPNGRTLRWRYVSKDGNWVLVHDGTNNGSKTLPNWYFVHRGCVSVANVD